MAGLEFDQGMSEQVFMICSDLPDLVRFGQPDLL